ncbi:MAG: putative DNA-binding domain [Pseudomonadota bacterium]
MFDYQKQFLEWLTALDERTPAESDIGNYLNESSVYRLNAYQESYLGRVTASLSETIFESCEHLFGKEFVAQVLASFFKAQPPTAESLTSAAEALPHFLRTLNKESRDALLFADMAEISMLRWRLLTSVDPIVVAPSASASLSELRLVQPAAFVAPSGHHSLERAWECSQAPHDEEFLPEGIFVEQRGVLLVKASAWEFSVVGVPQALEVFVSSLVEGRTVEEAVGCLEHEGSDELADLVQQMMAQLMGSRLLSL